MQREKQRMKETKNELHEFKEKLWKEQELCRQEKETQQEHVHQGSQHVQTDEIVPIHVVDSSEQLALGKQGEPLQDEDFAQGIE